MRRIDSDSGQFFFLDTLGGTGKKAFDKPVACQR